uniref:Reverse transcriptase domain-containing protein n=1 Tax=Tanacetum cinerariifolium TaxID=118510 RepID=A0A6L2JCL0_TANCI|nr:reverse transcriptase domain-containing protein [Tanacetum cinerariifolium]
MSTRSSARNLFLPLDNPELTIRRRSRSDPTLLNNSEMAAEGNDNLPVFDFRIMEKLCQPSLKGQGGHIASIAIQATNFGLKNDMIQQDTSAQRSESSSSITSFSDTKIAALKAKMPEINKNLMRVLQVNQQVKAVTSNCETCGGPHSFSDCPATIGNTQNFYTAGAYQGPTIPTTSSSPVVERETEANKDMVHPTSNRSTEDIQPPVVLTESPILNSEPVISPIIEHVASPVSAPKPNLRPLIPYPSRLQDQKLCDKANDQRFSDMIASGNRTPYYDLIVSTTSSTLTLFENSDFLLEEVDAFLALEDDPTSLEVTQSYVDTEGDILLLEVFLNDDPSLPLQIKEFICLNNPVSPQTSGQVEVSNCGLKRILERTVGENRASWSDKLDDALWAFRTAYKTPIRCIPYKLVYEKACHLPIELEHKAYWALKHENFDIQTAGDHRKVQLNELSDQAYENSLIYKEKTKRLHDSKIKDRVFNIGNRVLLFNSRLKIFSSKLKSRWSGPFTLSHVFLYGIVELSQPDRPNFNVNAHRLKHYFRKDVPKRLSLISKHSPRTIEFGELGQAKRP